MPHTVAIDFAQPMPLFPLASCALLPHATIPLHIFEPRYRKMTKEALAGSRLIAMATFRDGSPNHPPLQAQPALRPYVCVGCIIQHAKLPDDQYNLLLQGLCRARIVEELPADGYRRALLEPIERHRAMEIDLASERKNLETLLEDPLLRQLASVSAIHNWLSDEIPTAVLVDLAIMTACDDLEGRYAMLAEPSPTERSHWLETHLHDLRRTLSLAQRQGPGTTDDGLGLN
jgi:Lon protease-like protein